MPGQDKGSITVITTRVGSRSQPNWEGLSGSSSAVLALELQRAILLFYTFGGLPCPICFLEDFFSFIHGYCSCMDIMARGDIPVTPIPSIGKAKKYVCSTNSFLFNIFSFLYLSSNFYYVYLYNLSPIYNLTSKKSVCK